MNWRATKLNLDFDALLATPCDFDLSGHWRAYYPAPSGEVLSGVQLEQYGAAIFGRMQCKFAAATPLSIRGILLGERLVANYWRPDQQAMGSGILDLFFDRQSLHTAGREQRLVRLEHCQTIHLRMAMGEGRPLTWKWLPLRRAGGNEPVHEPCCPLPAYLAATLICTGWRASLPTS